MTKKKMQPISVIAIIIIIIQALLFGKSIVLAKDQPLPQYMTSLLKEVPAKNNTLPHNAQNVRSYISKESTSGSNFSFKIAGLDREEKVLVAELHIYIMKNENSSLRPNEIHVYQIVNSDQEILINDVRSNSDNPVSLDGWQVFTITSVVNDWIKNPSTSSKNLKLSVKAVTSNSEQVDLQVCWRTDGNVSYQPVLILFNSGDSSRPFRFARLPVSSNNKSLEQQKLSNSVQLEQTSDGRHKQHRQMYKRSAEANSPCKRMDLYVVLESLGWTWVISPKRVNIYSCSGTCSKLSTSTRHGDLQLAVDPRFVPCCAPKILKSFYVFTMNEYSANYKELEDAVVRECGCL